MCKDLNLFCLPSLSDFEKPLSIPDSFHYILHPLHLIQNFKKIVLVGSELFHADGRPDMTKKVVAFRIFAKVTEKFFQAKKRSRLITHVE
jgi:hypothetical protein